MEPNYTHELLDELARQGVEPNYIHELLDELARQGVEPNYTHELLDELARQLNTVLPYFYGITRFLFG